VADWVRLETGGDWWSTNAGMEGVRVVRGGGHECGISLRVG